MQVTSLLSRDEAKKHDHDHHHHDHDHAHDANCESCGHDHEHTQVKLTQTIIGLIFVLNAFVVDWALERATGVASMSAMIGAIVLGYPIVKLAFKDIRNGNLTINELVAI